MVLFMKIGVRVAEGRGCNGTGYTIVTLTDASTEKQVENALERLVANGWSDLQTLEHVGMIVGCKAKGIAQATATKIGDGIILAEEDDEEARTASWALDRLDQANLPLDNREYEPSNCTEHHGSVVDAYIIDTGCDAGHEAFLKRTIRNVAPPGSNLIRTVDDNGHGTAVASLLIGAGSGVAKGMNVTCIKSLGQNGEGKYSDVVRAMDYVISEREKIGMNERGTFAILSLTGSSKQKTSMDRAVQRAQRRGVMAFAAAGNQGGDACQYTPGRSAVSVAATDSRDELASFSNRGRCVDAVAPGVRVRAARLGGGMKWFSGTSFSAPLAAGVVAMQWPHASAQDLRGATVRVAGYPMPTLGTRCGGRMQYSIWRLVNASAAVASAALALLMLLVRAGRTSLADQSGTKV